MRNKLLLLAALFLFIAADVPAQRRGKQKQASTLSYPESVYSSVQWRSVGPFRGGRAGTVAGVVGDR
ncbi:MAG: hypothetical protein AAF840_19295, partial [Bacteroidota bacterium]